MVFGLSMDKFVLNYLDSACYMQALKTFIDPVLLQSGSDYSILTAQPFYSVDGSCSNPLEKIKTLLAEKSIAEENLPFPGGAIGYFSYDMARRFQKLPSLAKADILIPDIKVGFYDWALILDHRLQQAHLIRHPQPELADKTWQTIKTQLTAVAAETKTLAAETFQILSPFKSNLTQAEYTQAFAKIKDYILAGDCYQVNLAQRFSAEVTGSPWSAYHKLSQQLKAPFSAFLQYADFAILSFSPERFLKVQQGLVETKPIKGTRPRHSDPRLDAQLAQELAQSEKDRAENLMIVDLMRNDLSKVCQPGSVKVAKLFDIETFTTVHHMVSTVHGKLQSQKQAIDLLAACFPGGSVTGAPKIRAMEIIEELEPHRRSVYCGSIGYLGFNGNMDSNIAIRSLIWSQNKLHCYAGGAIVADSDAEAEYQETLTKVKRILQLLQNP